MTTRLLPLAAAVVFVTACGMPDTEESLVSDSELGAIQVEQGLTTEQPTSTTSTPGAFHLRLAWGYLAGNRTPPEWVSWTGKAVVTSGTMQLEHLIFFERRDFPLPSLAANELDWRSRTLPHFDGVVAKVTPGAATDTVTITMPRFTQSFDVASLAAGAEQHFVVDAEGHELSLSAVPDSGCGGFSLGYLRTSPEGWTGFAGLVLNQRGQRVGIVRFRADNGQVQARLLSGGAVVATGTGTLDAATKRFSITFTKRDGSSAGTLEGLYTDPSYSPRGSFQAHGLCN